MLLPEALQQDSFVGGVEYSRLLQVLLCDVTGKTRRHVRNIFKPYFHCYVTASTVLVPSPANACTRAWTSICLPVPEELQVVPAVVQQTLLIPLQSQSLQPLPHWRLSNRQRWATAAPKCLDRGNETQDQLKTKKDSKRYNKLAWDWLCHSSPQEGNTKNRRSCGKILQMALRTVKAWCKK